MTLKHRKRTVIGPQAQHPLAGMVEHASGLEHQLLHHCADASSLCAVAYRRIALVQLALADLRSEVGDDFEMPPGRKLRLLVFGEIVSASNFETLGSKIFVHYFVNLPVGWSMSEETTSTDLTGES